MPFEAAVPLSDHSGEKIVEQWIGRIIWVDDFDRVRADAVCQPTTMIAADGRMIRFGAKPAVIDTGNNKAVSIRWE
jgi:hypothetical protein